MTGGASIIWQIRSSCSAGAVVVQELFPAVQGDVLVAGQGWFGRVLQVPRFY